MNPLEEAQGLLEALKQIKAQAEVHLQEAETARKKADSEALYASNAKGACEGHSTTIAGLKGTVEADVTTIAANKQKSDELIAATTSGKAAIEADAKVIVDRRKEIEQAARELSSAVGQGEGHLREIEQSKTLAETSSKEAKEASGIAAEARAETERLSKKAEELAAKTIKAEETCSGRSTSIDELLKEAESNKDELVKIVEHLQKSDDISTKHEAQVLTHAEQLRSLIVKVEGLLPGATSTSLAYSFENQKKRFTSPQSRWLWTFIACIGGLVVVALPSFLAAISSKPPALTWEEISRLLVLRIPIVIPLVWLAIYAGRNYMLSLRLEEDYAYKEAISRAFEGYKREMSGVVTGQTSGPIPITTLCVNVLSALAERPGRIYEGKNKDITLLSEFASMVEKAEEFRKKQVSTT